jgi:adenosylcobinamide-phosphate synthase
VVNRATAVAVALLADRLLGERPLDPHPVSLFGTGMGVVEDHMYADDRARGALHAAVGVGVGILVGVVARSTALSTYVAVAGRALGEAAIDVESALLVGDIDRARSLLPSLVGRDPSDLGEKEIARAVVESVAENTVDAVVAPAMWAVALGAPGTLGYRAVNTLDAMVGHRSPRYLHYGWASARLDDVANWVPARATAALVAAARPRAAGMVWRTVRRDAVAHPSPNAGVAEAAFAAALGLRLGGENRYGEQLEVRPPLGDGRPPEAIDIGRAVSLSRDVATALAVGLFVAGGRKR